MRLSYNKDAMSTSLPCQNPDFCKCHFVAREKFELGLVDIVWCWSTLFEFAYDGRNPGPYLSSLTTDRACIVSIENQPSLVD